MNACEDPSSRNRLPARCLPIFDNLAQCTAQRLLEKQAKYCRQEHIDLMSFYSDNSEDKSSRINLARKRWKECTITQYRKPVQELLRIPFKAGTCVPAMPAEFS